MTQSVVSLDRIKNSLIFKFKSESELMKQIEKLSLNFTQKREKLNEYLSDEKMVAAYSCFYLLTNLPKLKASFELLNLKISDFKDYEFLDIGAGPATFSIALLEMDPHLKIRAIESSQLMIQQGERFIQTLFSEADFSYISKDMPYTKKENKRIGIFGHSANEMGASLAVEYILKLELDDIIFIEPGTKNFYKQFLKIREALHARYNILYPCFSSEKCPLSADDWCHQYLSVSHSFEVERLTQLAQKDRRNLPISLAYFKKPGLESQYENVSITSEIYSITTRIIRVYNPTKFSVEWQICFLDQSDANEVQRNVEKDLQILFRGLSKQEIKDLKNKRAGDTIVFVIEKVLSENKVRGKLR